MRVLVGIVSKNRCGILPTAIDSALMQQGVELGVAVYDDNSSDDTRSLKGRYPAVAWEFADVNRGYLYARNKFMKETRAEYFASLDDDSWFTSPYDLKTAIDYLDQNPDVGAVAFDIISPDRPDRVATGGTIETANFIGCGHVLRLSHVSAVNYYDPNPAYYGGEEKDLSIKLMNNGCRVVRLTGVHVWHEKTNVARDLAKQHRAGVCNDLVFAYRRTPAHIVVPALIAKIASHLRFAIKFERGKFLGACIKAIFDFFRILFTFKIKRNPVKADTFRRFLDLSRA